MSRTAVPSAYVPKPGSIVRFAPAGDTIESVTVAKDTKPPGSDFADWIELGCIETGTVEVLTDAGEPVYCFNATTGLDELVNTELTDADTRLQFALTLQQVTDYLWQLAFAADTPDATTGAFTPGGLKGGVKQGWCKVQVQVSTTVVAVLDLWVQIGLSDAAKIRDRTSGYKPAIQILQLVAPDETGVLGTPGA